MHFENKNTNLLNRNSIQCSYKKYRLKIIIALLLSFALIGPGLMMRWVIFLFDSGRHDRIAEVVWFVFLAVRTFIFIYFIYLLVCSFKVKKAMLKLYAIAFLLIEIPFTFITNSYGYVSYPSINWHCLYWHPLNSLGYRDVEPKDSGSCSQKIVITGDSYTAGMGITNIEHCYSYILRNKLGNGWCVYSAAESGIDTKEEIKRLKEYPVQGNYVIFQYYINDMDVAMQHHGIAFPDPPEVTYWLNPIVTATSIGDFLFFKYAHFFYANPDYTKAMQEAYQNTEVLKEHYTDLTNVVAYTKSINAKLIVVIYPELTDVETSNLMYVDKISAFFQDKAYRVIKVGDLVKNLPNEERVASEYDTHGGVKVHEAVAAKLFQIINQDSL